MAQDDFSYSIHRSARRRSICIEVRNAQVQVRAPFGVAEAELQAFVARKRAWIQVQLVRQRNQLAGLPVYSYAEGCRFPYLGGELCLKLGHSSRARIARIGDDLQVQLPPGADEHAQARRLVMRWYQQDALHLLERRTQALASHLGLVCSRVSVRATRSKWGHCTPDGAIQYNWQIILAPDPVVDYLVAHEVCHLRHLNHSPAFWDLVASVCPDYRAQRAWLRTEGGRLIL